MRYNPPYFDFELCGVKRRLPFVKIKEDMALASFCIVSDTELVAAAAPALAAKLPEVDVLITAEAKGIILTYEISRILGMKDFVVARKHKKPYMQNVLEANVFSITTQAKQTLYLDGCDVEKIRGKRVAIIDDVIATGESLAALEKLVELAGGHVVTRAALLAELDSVYRDDIIFLKEHFVFTPNDDGTFTPIECETKKRLRETEKGNDSRKTCSET